MGYHVAMSETEVNQYLPTEKSPARMINWKKDNPLGLAYTFSLFSSAHGYSCANWKGFQTAKGSGAEEHSLLWGTQI